MILFSIVTINLNDLENLKITSKSVLDQKNRDFEYIIVDGGSRDGSIQYIKSISPDRFISEPDNGIYFGMNKALGMCSGKYICFMNAGDVFYDKYILSIVAKAVKKNPNIPFFYGDVIYPAFRRYYMRQPSKLSKFLLFRTGICHQTWFLSREIYYEINGFDTAFKYEADFDLLLKIIIEKKLAYKHLSLCIAKYKGGGFSLSDMKGREEEREIIRKKYFTQKQIFWFSIWLRMLNYIKKRSIYEGVMSVLSRFYFGLTCCRSRQKGNRND